MNVPVSASLAHQAIASIVDFYSTAMQATAEQVEAGVSSSRSDRARMEEAYAYARKASDLSLAACRLADDVLAFLKLVPIPDSKPAAGGRDPARELHEDVRNRLVKLADEVLTGFAKLRPSNVPK